MFLVVACMYLGKMMSRNSPIGLGIKVRWIHHETLVVSRNVIVRGYYILMAGPLPYLGLGYRSFVRWFSVSEA